METVLYSICAVAGWTTFGYVLRLARRRPDPARWAFCVGCGFFAAGITIAIPPVSATIAGATDSAVLAKVLAHAGAVGIAASAERMLLFLALPPQLARPKARRWAWASTAAFAAMVALAVYLSANHPSALLVVDYARLPAVTAYLVIYLVVFAAYMIDIARLCRRYADVAAGRVWLRRGLRITAVGALFALAYCANKALYLAGFALGLRPSGERTVAAVLVTISSLLVLTGLTLPSWGSAIVAHRGRPSSLRAYRAMTPLWRDIIARVPQLELDATLRRPLPVWRDAEYALTRRVAEIRDGRLALRSYLDRRVTASAAEHAERAGLVGDDRQVVIEAAQLAAALRAHAHGTPAVEPEPAEPYNPPGGYAGEVNWLVRVSRAYASSPVVAAVLAAAPQAPADGEARPVSPRQAGKDEGPVRQPPAHPRPGSRA